MLVFNRIPQYGDPSEQQQIFERLNIHVLCCKYCWLEHWKSERMSFPYWRLYWNKTEGAYVYYKQKVHLTPDKILLIPPHTPFSTNISGRENYTNQPYYLKGGWVTGNDEENDNIIRGNVLHMYIHFNLGLNFDNITPGLYQFNVDNRYSELIQTISDATKDQDQNFHFFSSLSIYNLIISLVNHLPGNLWRKEKMDARVRNIIEWMERNTGETVTNEALALKAHMATNSFSRLFKNNIGTTPHSYMTRIKIDKACEMLHHTHLSIDKIAEQCGFADRYHFSKVFSGSLGVSPGVYRKSFVL
jgi:AraC-like DNA-binding protein